MIDFNVKLPGTIQTYSGKTVTLTDPRTDQLEIGDIARALAYNSHYGGHAPKFFSIAEHCLLVTELVKKHESDHPDLLMMALMHDASEAFLGDMVKPLKVLMPDFQKIERRMTACINFRFKLDGSYMATIKKYDRMAQEIEFNAFYNKQGSKLLHYLFPERAREDFLTLYHAINLKRNTTLGKKVSSPGYRFQNSII